MPWEGLLASKTGSTSEFRGAQAQLPVRGYGITTAWIKEPTAVPDAAERDHLIDTYLAQVTPLILKTTLAQ